MADKPARALVIYGDGLAAALGPQHRNLHALASAGSCGFLALRDNPDPGRIVVETCNCIAEDEAERVVREMAQLLDLYDVYSANVKAEGVAADEYSVSPNGIPSLSSRFMGIKGAFMTNSKPAAAFGASAGFAVKALDDLQTSANRQIKLPDPSVVATSSLNMLNLSADSVRTDFELVFVHILGSDKEDVSENEVSAAEGVSWVDRVVAKLSELSQPGTKAASHLYLAVILSYGSTPSRSVEHSLPSLTSLANLPEDLLRFRPKQSYTLKGDNQVEDVRDHAPLLAVYYLSGVTRRDEAMSFGFDEFAKRGGNLTILADRALHEIAFKLWKAPKYGA